MYIYIFYCPIVNLAYTTPKYNWSPLTKPQHLFSSLFLFLYNIDSCYVQCGLLLSVFSFVMQLPIQKSLCLQLGNDPVLRLIETHQY